MRIRSGLVVLPLFAIFAALGARLAHIQIAEHERWARMGERQRRGRRRVPAPRGKIYSAHGEPLAHSQPSKIAIADLKLLRDPAAAAQALAPLLEQPAAYLARRMARKDRRIVYLARHVPPERARAVAALKIRGIGFEEAFQRRYPSAFLACHVLGWAGSDGGKEGLEKRLDPLLSGLPGYVITERDAARRALSLGDGRSFTSRARRPRSGLSVTLTIHAGLQQVAENELARIMREFKPRSATALLMDVRSGALLALACRPGYDPNHPGEAPPENRRNRALTDCYEPGSTFKTFIAAMALERGLCRRSERFFCENGAWRRGYRTLHDAHAYGWLRFEDVIVKSSNIGAAKIGLRLGLDRTFGTVRAFGFGERTGIDLPGEGTGIVRPRRRWTRDSLLSVPMGQEIAVTPLQLVTAYAAMINGGDLLRPQVVARIQGRSGEVLYALRPQMVRQVVSPRISRAMREILHAAVFRGTGRRAWCREYALGGKTGTAQKLVDGHYSHTQYVGSFCGFGPVRNPRLACLVTVNAPDKRRGYYGGTVAAPAVRELLRRGLKALGVPPRTPDQQARAEKAFRNRSGG